MASRKPFTATTRRARWGSAAEGEHVAVVNGEEHGLHPTRKEARRAADRKAEELNRDWASERSQ